MSKKCSQCSFQHETVVKFEEKKRMTDFSCKFFFPFYRMKKKMSLFIFKNLSNFCFHRLYFV